MKKYLLIVMLLLLPFKLFAEEKKINPGYFESPFMLMVGGTQSYGNKETRRDKSIQPYILGMFNVFQSEYGNIALSTAFTMMNPYRDYEIEGTSFRVSSSNYVGELGLNYMTGSKSYNFFLGAGYNWTYSKGKMHKISKGSSSSSKTENFSQTVPGWHYYLGMQYFVKDNWGVFFLIRGQETNRAKYSFNGEIPYSDGTVSRFNNNFTMDLSNRSYVFGFTYSL